MSASAWFTRCALDVNPLSRRTIPLVLDETQSSAPWPTRRSVLPGWFRGVRSRWAGTRTMSGISCGNAFGR